MSEIKYYALSLISEIFWLAHFQKMVLLWVLSGFNKEYNLLRHYFNTVNVML
jgi:hypothetical protein